VGRLLFRRTHKSSGHEGSSIVIETLPRSDSKTVSVDSHRQCDSGGLSSDSRGGPEVHLSKGWTSITTTEVWKQQEYKPPTFE
jgi:hypothetical protein